MTNDTILKGTLTLNAHAPGRCQRCGKTNIFTRQVTSVDYEAPLDDLSEAVTLNPAQMPDNTFSLSITLDEQTLAHKLLQEQARRQAMGIFTPDHRSVICTQCALKRVEQHFLGPWPMAKAQAEEEMRKAHQFVKPALSHKGIVYLALVWLIERDPAAKTQAVCARKDDMEFMPEDVLRAIALTQRPTGVWKPGDDEVLG